MGIEHSAQFQLRHAGLKGFHGPDHTVGSQCGAVLIMGDLIGIVGAPRAVRTNQQSRGVLHMVSARRLLHRFRHEGRNVKAVAVAAILGGKQLPAHQTRFPSRLNARLPQKLLQRALPLHGLIGQGKEGTVNGLGRNAAALYKLHIFVADDQGGGSIGLQHQQPFLKPCHKAGQVFKIAAVLHVAVDHQRFKTGGFHPFQHLLQPLRNGFILQHDGSGRVQLRMGDFP